MPERSDEEVARVIQQGDTESFGLLMERYEAKMARYAKKFLFDSEDSQDLTQEVFIKAYTNIQSFDIEKKFSSWLYRIAHNTFINALRKKSKIHIFSLDADLLFPHSIVREAAVSDTERQELRTLLELGLNTLAPKYREPLVLHYFEDLSYQEIAEVLRIPVSTVGVRLQRSKAKLKKFLSQREKYDART